MTPLVDLFTKAVSILTLAGDITVVIIFFALLMKNSDWAKATLNYFGSQATLMALVIVLGGILGSLFYSEVAGFRPCVLCWWQRIFLYPQILILGFGLWRKNKMIWNYILGLSVIGGLVALYNTYLQFGGFSPLPCSATGVSCTQRYFLEFGYITIPTMSLTAFLLLIALAVTYKLKNKTSIDK